MANGKRALLGKRVLVPRPKHQAEETARLLRERGAVPVIMPLIEVGPPPSREPLGRAVRALSQYDLVALTSANAVDAVLGELRAQGREAGELALVKVASIGPGTTAALENAGIIPDIVASQHVGEGMAETIIAALSDASRERTPRVLLPRALVAREELPSMLREAGIELDVVAAYETRPVSREDCEALRNQLEQGAIDALLLTSSSTVTSLCDALGERAGELLAHTVLATIGPIAEETARARGLRVGVSAEPYTVPALLDALERFFSSGEG